MRIIVRLDSGRAANGILDVDFTRIPRHVQQLAGKFSKNWSDSRRYSRPSVGPNFSLDSPKTRR